jgi:hypothetical protein
MRDTLNVVARQEAPVQNRISPVPEVPASVIKPLNREAQLSQMVDDLVGPDEDDIVLPALPGNTFESENNSSRVPGYKSKAPLRGISPRAFQAVRTPELRTEAWQLPLSPTGVPSQRLHSVSNIWNDAPVRETSPITPFGSAPPGLPPIPASARHSNAHSRVNSTNSVRSPLPQRLSRLRIPTIALAHAETVIRASRGTMRAYRALFFSGQARLPGVQDPGSQYPTSHRPMVKVVERPEALS